MIFPTYNQCQSEFTAGNVYRNESPCGNYVLFNYKPHVEYDNLWNDINVWCRGIIFDIHNGNVVAVPFRKFWNVGQKPETSEENLAKLGEPVVMSKEDGSLGILFWNKYERKWQVATRGSFTSDQAAWATDWIREKVRECGFPVAFHEAMAGKTNLFEIVYPENKIVANYNGFAGLIYLNTVCHFNDGQNCYLFPRHSTFDIFGYRTARFYKFSDFAKMRELLSTFTKDDEGFVLQFPDGTMAKMKGPEYLRVHKIRSSLTIENVADLVIATGAFKAALNQLPDEFWGDYLPAINAFEEAVSTTMACAASAKCLLGSRKEKALWIQSNLARENWAPAFLFIDGNIAKAFATACKFHAKSGKFHFKTFLGNG